MYQICQLQCDQVSTEGRAHPGQQCTSRARSSPSERSWPRTKTWISSTLPGRPGLLSLLPDAGRWASAGLWCPPLPRQFHPPPQPRRETVCGRIWLPLSVDGLTPGPSPSTVFPPYSQPRNPTSHHSLPMGLIRRDRARPWEEGTAPARTEGEMRACKGILSGKLKLKEPFYTTAHL